MSSVDVHYYPCSRCAVSTHCNAPRPSVRPSAAVLLLRARFGESRISISSLKNCCCCAAIELLLVVLLHTASSTVVVVVSSSSLQQHSPEELHASKDPHAPRAGVGLLSGRHPQSPHAKAPSSCSAYYARSCLTNFPFF